MSNRYGLFVGLFLEALDLDVPLSPLESTYEWMQRKSKNDISRKRFQETAWHMKRQGYFKIVEKQSQKFIQLTNKGKLEKLLRKAKISKKTKWDGKWRVLVFDIPESSRPQRDRFRSLLRVNNFIKLQASVFICPYSLNKQAIEFLNQSGLGDYIRIMRVDKMDNDKDLIKKFHLKKSRS